MTAILLDREQVLDLASEAATTGELSAALAVAQKWSKTHPADPVMPKVVDLLVTAKRKRNLRSPTPPFS
ncbi:MAG TPA: hypothetical protein VEX37_12350 [Thermomicrobiales bacterium]|nr:hypothetical protein [Thermomicrobiales bacterium]